MSTVITQALQKLR